MPGVGGDCSGLVFPFRFGLLHSRKFTDPPLWEASDCEVVFLNNLDRRFGLIGMDVIRQWRAMTFEPRATGGGVIEIDF